jgi:hypothetical protein
MLDDTQIKDHPMRHQLCSIHTGVKADALG